jgi:hypothetical protein
LLKAWRSATPRKVPRLSRRLVSAAKNSSTASSHEALVGVKWKVMRGWRASQAITADQVRQALRVLVGGGLLWISFILI